MIDDQVGINLRNMIMFGINKTAVLYNNAILQDPIKYNYTYQYDHLWFQEKMTNSPGFYRVLFVLSRKSKNFINNRTFVMKAVLLDICQRKFNTNNLSGLPDLHRYYKKGFDSNYNPRHTRRKFTDDLQDLVIKDGRLDDDKRKISYSTAFTLDDKINDSFSPSLKMWHDEINSLNLNLDNAVKIRRQALIREIFPERWVELKQMQKEMLSILSTELIKDKDVYFPFLRKEVESFSAYFIMLSNHINSISEISWFMGKDHGKRCSIMNNNYKLLVVWDDINKTLEKMQEIFTSSEIVSRLYGVPEALLWYGNKEVAVILIKRLIDLETYDERKIELEIEYAALLRNLTKYKEMFTVINLAISNYKGQQNTLEYALLKIRHAEAVAFNGSKQNAIKELDEIFERKHEFKGNYTPSNVVAQENIKYVLREGYTNSDTKSVPIKISVLENLIGASDRIGVYCLEIKYIEDLLYNEKEYFQNIDTIDMFLNLHKQLNKTIFLCSRE